MLYFVLILLPFWLGCHSSSSEDSPTEQESNPCFSLDQISCFECLADSNPEGFQRYQESIISSCYCGSECYNRCENFCDNQGSIESQCQECFDIVSQLPQSFCIWGVLEQCEQDDACTIFVFEIQSCSP